MARYYIEKYTDVIETEKGWAVQSTQKDVFQTIEVSDASKEKDVCKALKAEGAVPDNSTMRTIQFSSFDSDIIEVSQKKDSKPVCRLVRKKF